MEGGKRNMVYVVILVAGAPMFTMFLWSQSGVPLTFSNVASMADLGGMLWAAFVLFLRGIKMGLDMLDERWKAIMIRVRGWLGLSS